MPRGRRMAIQVLGFVIGVALIVWCIRRAAAGADWSRVLHASPVHVAGLLGFTLVSLLMAGSAFWITILPLHRMRWTELQGLNFVASLLNYAPVRLGLVTRIAWHLRVDHLAPLTVVGWFGAMALMMGVAIGSAAVATLVHPRIDLAWAGILVLLLVVGGLLLRTMVQTPLARVVTRRLHGSERLLVHPVSLWGGILVRVLDLTAFAGRMYCAALICGVEFAVSDALLIAIAAQVISLSPFGRVGFREAAVAFVASRLSSGPGTDVDAVFAQLALVDSIGEVAVIIPLGVLSIPWLVRGMRRGSDEPRRGRSPSVGDEAQGSHPSS